ncbi:hypothetical protein [Nonomuraea dietziae]|uniref:hypothetical protein n=1 Tax=Nonomuraea dietziae TaxID=65515 RepID=UPI0031D210B2
MDGALVFVRADAGGQSQAGHEAESAAIRPARERSTPAEIYLGSAASLRVKLHGRLRPLAPRGQAAA